MHDENQAKSKAWYYDGKSREIKPTFTGCGMLVYSEYLAVGYFKDRQAEGRCVSFQVNIDAETAEREREMRLTLTELNVENGWMITESRSQGWLNECRMIVGFILPFLWREACLT